MRVYVDGVMVVNFLVDGLLLLGTNRVYGCPSEKKRILGAAILGAVYSGLCLYPDFRFLGNLLWRLVCLALMGGLAFGWNRSGVQRCGIFLFLSLALGGLAISLGRTDFWGLVLAGGCLWLLSRFSFDSGDSSREYIPIQIRHGEQTVNLLALRDTGNTLHDPITGRPVLVIGASTATRLTGLTEQQLKNPLGTMADQRVPGLQLIPFRTVGQSGGMMLAMQFEDVVVNGRRQKVLVAFAPENFGSGTAYQALTGGVF